MSLPVHFLFILLFLCQEISGQRILSAKEQQRDFTILKKTLLENTGSPYLFIDSISLSKKFSEIEKKLNEPRTDVAFFKLIAPAVTIIGCGHTQIFPSKGVLRNFYSSNGILPFNVLLVDKKLYALSSFGKNPRIKRGDQIIEINAMNVTKMLDEMYPYISSDGFNTTKKERVFKDLFLLYYFIAFGPQVKFEIKFISAKGEKQTLNASGGLPPQGIYNFSADNPIFYEPKKGDYGTLKIDKKKNVSIFKFRSFKYAKDKGYESFLEESFKKIEKSKTKYLIVDLRGNGGGWPQFSFLGFLTGSKEEILEDRCNDVTKPFYNRHIKKFNEDYRRYKRTVRNVRRSARKETVYSFRAKVKKQFRFTGKKIVVLVDGHTFSAASHLATCLKTMCNATIIGEHTGGSYSKFNTGLLELKLPESKIRVGINPILVKIPSNINAGHTGLPPDIQIHETYPKKSKEDPWMKAALDYICLID